MNNRNTGVHSQVEAWEREKIILNTKISKVLVFFVFFSFFLPNISLYIGFYFKLFMFSSIILFTILMVKKNYKVYLSQIDYLFLFFIVYASSTVLFSVDFVSGMRMIFGSFIIFFSYIIIKSFLIHSKLSIDKVEKLFLISSSLFIVISLLMYLYGFIIISGSYSQYEHVRVFGILVERGMPRMIGTLNDPNFFCFYSSIFFFYLLLKKRTFKENFLFILVIISIFLTFSISGISSIIFSSLIFFMYSFFKVMCISRIKFKNLINIIIILFFFTIFVYYINIYLDGFLSNILEKRISGAEQGSGRFEIWNNLIGLWKEFPIFGIGWYNFLTYNTEYFGRGNYAHNTFLEVLVETGIVGFIIYILFIISILLKIYFIVKNDSKFLYLFYGFISMLILMNSLSTLINEYLFFLIALIGTYDILLKRQFEVNASILKE